jgi:hypothetical protein
MGETRTDRSHLAMVGSVLRVDRHKQKEQRDYEERQLHRPML